MADSWQTQTFFKLLINEQVFAENDNNGYLVNINNI